MVTLLEKVETKQVSKTAKQDEFEKFLQRQRSTATFYGREVGSFSSYKKILGLM